MKEALLYALAEAELEALEMAELLAEGDDLPLDDRPGRYEGKLREDD